MLARQTLLGYFEHIWWPYGAPGMSGFKEGGQLLDAHNVKP